METALWIIGLVVGLIVVDRILLWVESRGWIYYRKNKPGRGASTYHLLEWNSAFDPTMRQVLEERIREKKEEEEAGDPPVPDDLEGAGSGVPGEEKMESAAGGQEARHKGGEEEGRMD